MKIKPLIGFVALGIVIGLITLGCNPDPTVVTTPGRTTVVRDHSTPPTVVVQPPDSHSTHTSTHTNTNTTSPPNTGSTGMTSGADTAGTGSSSTSTTTTG